MRRALLARSGGSGSFPVPPAPEVHFYHVAHCDDDGIWMNLDIANQYLAGNVIHDAVYTDMTTDPIYPLLKGTSGSCWWHGVTHTFSTMTPAEFTSYRDAEGAANIGHFGGTFHVATSRPASDALTREFCASAMAVFEAAYPGAIHHAMSWVDSQHADHRATGYGLRDLVDAGTIPTERAVFHLRTEDMAGHAGTVVTASPGAADLSIAGALEFKVYDPGSGRYAIGYHNAHWWFDDQYVTPTAKTHTSAQNR